MPTTGRAGSADRSWQAPTKGDRSLGSCSVLSSQAGDEEAVQAAAPGQISGQGAHVARGGGLDRQAAKLARADRRPRDRQAAAKSLLDHFETFFRLERAAR